MAADICVYTIISRDVDLLRWCVENARARAGVEHEWLVIGWNPTGDVLRECERLGVRCIPLDLLPSPGSGAHPEQRTAWFIRCLYRCWNQGYESATTKWVARMGSDQFFSRNWLRNLLSCAERHGEHAVYHVNTVESPIAKRSRHEIRDWGTTPAEFDARGRAQFDAYADDLAHRFRSFPTVRGDECNLWYDHPTRGRQRRADGVTWLQTRALWEALGPMNDRVVNGVAPDVAYLDRNAGVPGYLCLTATSYHLVRSESRHIQGI